MLRYIAAVLALTLAPTFALALAPTSAFAQESGTSSPVVDPDQISQEEEALEQRAAQVFLLFKDRAKAEDVFTDQFLTSVSAPQLSVILGQIESQFGPVQDVQDVERTGPYRAKLTLRFENAFGAGPMVLNPKEPHKVEGLLLNEFTPIGDGIEKIKEELEALPGEVGVYFGSLDGMTPRLTINPDKQLAIGSTFKLYVLSALAREMDADNEKYWDDVESIGTELCLTPPCEAEGRSFPSGITHDWPAPSPMTLQTLATLMISISDNTATDALMAYLGEERIVQEMIDSGHSRPELNQPFLTTRQMFALKSGGSDTIEAYRAAKPEDKHALAYAAAERDIEQADIENAFATGPLALDIEWFASAHDLRRLLVHFPDTKWKTEREIMALNPSVGPAIHRRYGPIYYKGGSEPGVLNFTWLLKDVHGWQVLTMSWNNPDEVVDETQFQLMAQRLLSIPF